MSVALGAAVPFSSRRRAPMFPALRAMFRDPEGKILVIFAIGTISFGTVAYMQLEGWSAIDALYFSVVTLATVGFGDLHPTTEVGKLFTVGYILFGIGILAGFASELTKDRRAVFARRRTESRMPLGEKGPDQERPGAGPAA
jgi:voltage-gated potassium channel